MFVLLFQIGFAAVEQIRLFVFLIFDVFDDTFHVSSISAAVQMPTGAAFSYGLRSKCTDLAELLFILSYFAEEDKR